MKESQSTREPHYERITIPAANESSGIGAKLIDLLPLAWKTRQIASIAIMEYMPTGANRGAILVASPRVGAETVVAADFDNHGYYRPLGTPWYAPSDYSHNAYVRSFTNDPVDAIVEIV